MYNGVFLCYLDSPLSPTIPVLHHFDMAVGVGMGMGMGVGILTIFFILPYLTIVRLLIHARVHILP